jgi:hypothetical protein
MAAPSTSGLILLDDADESGRTRAWRWIPWLSGPAVDCGDHRPQATLSAALLLRRLSFWLPIPPNTLTARRKRSRS